MNKRYLLLVILVSLVCYGFPLAAQPIPKISLDLKGMDVVEALKTLASKGNMNLVIGSNVRGRVTMFLKQVAVEDAFEIILAANGLASERKGDIIYVMSQKDYEAIYGEKYGDKRQARTIQLKYAKALEVEKVLSQIKTKVGKIIISEGSNTLVIIDIPKAIDQALDLIERIDKPTNTVVFELSYAKAEDLSTKLNDALTTGVGTLQVDERTNKIVVTDLETNIEKIRKVIEEFDERPRQVLIDAKIVEINPSRQFHSGIDWDYWIDKYFRVQGAFNFPIPTDVTDKITFGTIGIADTAAKGDYTGIMDFLEIFGETKILSSPRILVLNNQEAKILVGKKDAYITSTTTATGDNPITAQTVNFVDTGVKLYVTPAINKDGYVTLQIRPEISSYATDLITVEGQKTDVPIVTTSEAETTVIVKDGVSILIGGLRKVTYDNEKKQIPFLGRIPLLGFFFRGQRDEWEKDELVIVLTPRIVSGDDSIETEIKARDDEVIWESQALEEFPKDGLRKEKKEKTLDEVKTQPKPKQKWLRSRAKTKYHRKITNQIGINPKSSPLLAKAKGKKGKVKLSILLSRNGELVEEPVVISINGDKSLGLLAKQIVKESAPFSPFPANSPAETETFKVLITF